MPQNPDFGTFGRYNELPIEQMTAEQKAAYDFTVKLRGQVPGAAQDLGVESKVKRSHRAGGRLLPEALVSFESGN
jgi:hypothetical protein